MSASVERVQQALTAAGLASRVVELPVSARTAALAASALGVTIGHIAKTLVVMADGQPVVALVAGDKRADMGKIGAVLQAQSVRMANADEVRSATGFAIGGVAPLGYEKDLTILADTSLQRFDTVYAAAGAPQAVFPVETAALFRAVGARCCDIVVEN